MFTKSVFVSLALLLFSLTSYASVPVDGAFARIFGVLKDDTITLDRGGEVIDYEAAAQDVLKTSRHIKIDGGCFFACAVFADKARPNVCITPNVMFRFGQTTALMIKTSAYDVTRSETYVVRGLPPVSSDIEGWVMKHGGFPSEGSLVMDAKDAAAFWPMCK